LVVVYFWQNPVSPVKQALTEYIKKSQRIRKKAETRKVEKKVKYEKHEKNQNVKRITNASFFSP